MFLKRLNGKSQENHLRESFSAKYTGHPFGNGGLSLINPWNTA